jgi:hypothetical protein
MIDHVQLAIRYGRIYSLMHRVLDRRMVAEGASLARTKMLHYIANNAPVRAADVAEWFDLAPRTVTQAIDTMERDAPSDWILPTRAAKSCARPSRFAVN